MIKKVIHPLTPIIIFCLSIVLGWGFNILMALLLRLFPDLKFDRIILGAVQIVPSFILPACGIGIAITLISRKEKNTLSVIGLILNLLMLLVPLLFVLFFFFGDWH